MGFWSKLFGKKKESECKEECCCGCDEKKDGACATEVEPEVEAETDAE